MLSFKIDLGQIIISGLLVIIGWFIKKELIRFRDRIDNHDKMIIDLVGKVQRLIGYYEAGKRSTFLED